MFQSKVEEYVPELKRMEIFQALVELQDTGELSVPQSRKTIAERFGVSEGQIKKIEVEGLDRQWPPL